MIVVGISGRKRSGKDSIADALVLHHGFIKLPFADALKDFVSELLGVSRDVVEEPGWKTRGVLNIGDGTAPLTGRQVLQLVGVAGRNNFGPNFWIQQVSRRAVTLERVVIPDVRFWNELHAIREWSTHSMVLRTNRADRFGGHDFVPFDDGQCGFGYTKIKASGEVEVDQRCDLPDKSHPSHFSGDTHESETTLPDASPLYYQTINAASGEEAADWGRMVVKDWLGKLR